MLEFTEVNGRRFKRWVGTRIYTSADAEGVLMCECTNANFNILQPGTEKQTTARCSWCGIEEVVHE